MAAAGDGPGCLIPRSGSSRGSCGCRGDKRAGRRPSVYGVARALEPVPGASPGNEANREQAEAPAEIHPCFPAPLVAGRTAPLPCSIP
jgi:hypothetical protein